jgi:hypothetical protein
MENDADNPGTPQSAEAGANAASEQAPSTVETTVKSMESEMETPNASETVADPPSKPAPSMAEIGMMSMENDVEICRTPDAPSVVTDPPPKRAISVVEIDDIPEAKPTDDQSSAKSSKRARGVVEIDVSEPVTSLPHNAVQNDAKPDDVLPLANWMMSWRQGTDRVGRSTSAANEEKVAAFALEEELRRAEEESQKKMELDAAVQSLYAEFVPLVETTESRVAKARAIATRLECDLDASEKEVLMMADEFEQNRSGAQAAVRACIGYSAGEHYMVLQNSVCPAKKMANELLQRAKKAAGQLLQAVSSVKALRQDAEKRQDDEAKKKAAIQAAKNEEQMFKRYDRDGDGLLRFSDVRAFISGEYNLELSEEKLRDVLQVESLSKFTAVPWQDFPRLRYRVGIASVAGALDGLDVQVAKAESQARPLSARGPVKFPLRQLPDALEKLDSAIDEANDYLAAGRDQVQGILDEVAASPETKKLSLRLKDLEARLEQSRAVAGTCRERIAVHEKKTALMKQLDAVSH